MDPHNFFASQDPGNLPTRDLGANQFQHIVFPREERRRQPVDLAPGHAGLLNAAAEEELPQAEAQFLTWLFKAAGLDARQYRAETLQRRLTACLRALRANSLTQARQTLEQNPELFPIALNSMLVGVTSFFRDPIVFEHLRNEILPELVGNRKGIYAWSIGCSEGAELYSLAMILADRGLLEGSYLLGTDCRSDAVEHAREGRYPVGMLSSIPARFAQYCPFEDGEFCRVAESVRKRVRWRVGNMLGELEAGLWDLILFRNTAMYLRTEAAALLWPRLEVALRPGGVLILGRAERPNGAQRLRALGPCVYRRHRS